ncbi:MULTISPECIES: molybdate ABC transporter permease subunit [unclassified Prosthecochloris]|uniref:molybdate ABC transporter permease subunit n=1 Tax=unclassified Prosthecochloris TaxID=2632826 RepID=UPI00223E032D|nr:MULTISPECIES: molybdate ABC transporter permease subunit [unclassified Prosthecochloris]UZJ37208.1 molybdate ABC transporter permease subunit [Prosthecochloris sp. SCSIO W1103]UZJ39021.1 molybdate ABC transporter permease subunit [Prosthecochloris sp. SCSIO W1102]
MNSGFDIQPFLLSFRLAAITTVMLFIISVPLAWKLSQTRSRSKPFVEALVSMPIVLPPTVLGFYLLVFLSDRSPLGGFIKEVLGLDLVFTFEGVLVASCIYSFPFMLQPLQSGMEQVPVKLLEASYTLGKSKFNTLFHVILPNIKPSLLTGLIITFAHTVGEFGVVLMVGGSIQGETRVASIAIYELVELLDYRTAHIYSLILIAFSFIVLMSVYILNHRKKSTG